LQCVSTTEAKSSSFHKRIRNVYLIREVFLPEKSFLKFIMKTTDFVHLHTHSEYSLLDGLPKVKNMVALVKEMGMTALALTDHGNMYGAIEFYKTCLKNEIKPIIGCEVYTAPQGRKIKTPDNRQNYHLILLAKNQTGYKNLMRLVSIAAMEGFYYKPRIDWEILEKYHQGLICTTACIEGEVPALLLSGNYETAKKKAEDFLTLFGNDFYLEIQNHPGLKEQKKTNERIIKISRELGVPLVATNDSHYLRKEDAFAQDVLLMINTQTTVKSPKRLSMVDVPDFYIKSPEQMAEEFRDFPDALKNTAEIAEKCNLEIELGKWHFPKFFIPKNQTPENFLREKAFSKAKEHYGDPLSSEIKERLEYELEIICSKGYATYFLIMEDFIHWTEENDAVVNTRGSAAGSLVSFVLEITSVDPLIYQIPFERFLNKDRPTPPDIDLDISDSKRQALLYHIIDKYGENSVAQICTFGRMLAKGAVRDTARVLAYPYSVGDRISKLIPFGTQGFPMSIDKALKITPDLKSLYDTDEEAKKILNAAKQIEGCARHISVHACGLVISPTEIVDFTPIQIESGGDKTITQYEMHAVEDVGLIKIDILGIDYLSILGNAIVNVRKTRDIEIDLRKIPLDDKKTYKMLTAGNTTGVFQLGGEGMTKWLKELMPNRVEDLMAMVALYRPGPMAVIPEYIARKRDPAKITYIHPKLKDFLQKSYGLLVYQDDCLYTAIVLAGYSWVEADKFRKAIGKKIPEEMAAQKEKFIEGCVKNGIPKKQAEDIFALIEPFVGYGFNKAHAASYGMLSYQTGYMKANYPVEYMCALLTAEADSLDKVKAGVEECRKMGIIVKAPEINLSESDFTIEKNEDSLAGAAIRFGLNAVKNVGAAALEEILKVRDENGEFVSLTDFCLRTNGQKVNKKVMESLIKAGAFDRFGKRKAMLVVLAEIKQRCDKMQKERANGQTGLFGQIEQKEKTSAKDNFSDMEEFSGEELLKLEKEMIGIYLTEHPLRQKLKQIEGLTSHKLSQVADEGVGLVKVAGIITSVRVVTTRNGNKEMAFVSIEDETSQVDLVVFPSCYQETKEILRLDRIIVAEAKIDKKDKGFSLLAEKIFDPEKSLSEDNKHAKDANFDFTIQIPEGTNGGRLVEINSLLKKNPGKHLGLIRFPNGKEVKIMFGVNWSRELEKEIRKTLISNN